MTPIETVLAGVGFTLCSIGAVALIQFWVFGERPEDRQPTTAETNDS
ncbi:hypothetical protein [Halococcus saccharolyticus]|nr:hypothetical protein [Halococcus saccharolyticus]